MRHSRENLKAMAREALVARDTGDVRWQLLVIRMVLLTGFESAAVERGIEAIAQGVWA